MADGTRACTFSLAGHDRGAFWSRGMAGTYGYQESEHSRLLWVTTFMALPEIILMMGSYTSLPCCSHKRIPTIRVCSLRHKIPVIGTWFKTTAKLRFSHKNAQPRDASGSSPATLQWKPSRSTISAGSPQAVFFKATIPGRNTGWFPWGENSLGFPSQYPRDSITGPIIYCCTEGHSNAQWLTTTTIFIFHDLESQEFGKGSVGWFWQSARRWLKSLGSIQPGWSCLVPWPGWMEGWTLQRTLTRGSVHVFSSLEVLV